MVLGDQSIFKEHMSLLSPWGGAPSQRGGKIRAFSKSTGVHCPHGEGLCLNGEKTAGEKGNFILSELGISGDLGCWSSWVVFRGFN